MIDVLVFSKNRAAQLDLLLRTLERHAGQLYDEITVLWTGSSAEYQRGYGLVFCEHPRVRFTYEHSFELQVREWLAAAGETVSFLVDDDVFYRDATAPASLPWSFRGGDYDYPFSVDGNVYRRRDVIELLRRLHFRDPTELEAIAHVHRERLPFDAVTPCVPPCLIGIPANRVSCSSGMPHMNVDPYTLNHWFLRGLRLTFELPEHDGTHANLNLDWLREPVSA